MNDLFEVSWKLQKPKSGQNPNDCVLPMPHCPGCPVLFSPSCGCQGKGCEQNDQIGLLASDSSGSSYHLAIGHGLE